MSDDVTGPPAAGWAFDAEFGRRGAQLLCAYLDGPPALDAAAEEFVFSATTGQELRLLVAGVLHAARAALGPDEEAGRARLGEVLMISAARRELGERLAALADVPRGVQVVPDDAVRRLALQVLTEVLSRRRTDDEAVGRLIGSVPADRIRVFPALVAEYARLLAQQDREELHRRGQLLLMALAKRDVS